MGMYSEIVVTPEELYCSKTICKKVVIPRKNNFLIKGVILDYNDNPISGAVILIVEIDRSYDKPTYTDIGYYIADIDGSYAIALKKKLNVDYKIEVFEPPIECLYND